MRRPLPPLIVLIVPAALALGSVASLAGCGIDEGVVARTAGANPTTTTTTAPVAVTEPVPAEASSFAVEAVPDGYELRVMGAGEDRPGPDDLPVTVLAPDGEPVGAAVVLVELVEAAPPEGRGAPDDGFDDDGRWASLTGDGVRVWGIDATEDDLRAVAETATLSDEPRDAPVVDDPPDGLDVVGSITVDGVLGLHAGVPGDPDDPVPGPTSAHTGVWVDGASSLVVMTLPRSALDPAAVVTEAREPRRVVDEPRDAVAEEVGVGEATGIVTTTADAETGAVVRRELAVEAPWGDVLLVISRGAEILDADALVEVAESVEA